MMPKLQSETAFQVKLLPPYSNFFNNNQN